jgi:Activator of Hsp90 ATPase homolog 1-like protein
MSQDFQYSMSANVSAEDAYRKVARVCEWWNKKSTGTALRVGDTFKVDWGQAWADFKVVEAVPNKRVVWYVEDCHLPWLKNQTEWKDMKVVWDLAEQNGTTQIKMTHVGLTPEVECFKACEAGWNFHLGESLLKLLTEGHGLPDHGKSN